MGKETEPKQKLGTCVVVTNPEKTHILLGKRLNSYGAGFYGMPGGRLDLGEPLDTCAARELSEEIQIEAKQVTFLGTIRDNQDTYDFIHFAFICDEYEGEITLAEPEKCEGWEWHTLDDLPEPILPGHTAAIELYRTAKENRNTFLVDMARPQ